MSKYPSDVEPKTTARGPFGGTYDVAEFFPCMGKNWQKAEACLRPLLPSWMRRMGGPVEGNHAFTVEKQYDDVATFKRYVAEPLEQELNARLTDGSFVIVGGHYAKGKPRRGDSSCFGLVLQITHHDKDGLQIQGSVFSGVVVFQNRAHWEIDFVPDVNDRTRNDPVWLLQSKDTKVHGPSVVPTGMRLDMYGQVCVENGWTDYRVMGQQILLTVELVIKKAE
ncbi:hypothetical protein pEaSNUABM11_00200 [Erwinia phage pEa_SNUABM_11]|nr:hypothetical protein pEaSNUABM11_00200 [Erwinia phage pEa_SNUABM_11]